MRDPICAALVLNYNGRHLLQENLASVVSAAQKVEGGCDVIVLDNLSTDGSVEFVKENYPGVIVEVAPSNRILFSYNELCRRIRHKYVALLNNDLGLRDDSLSVLLRHCAAPDVFAVSAVPVGRGRQGGHAPPDAWGIASGAVPRGGAPGKSDGADPGCRLLRGI